MLMTKLEKKLNKIALSLYHVPKTEQKHFSFIVRKNKILSVGWNDTKTNPLSNKFDYWTDSTHSELSAIKRYEYDLDILKDCVMYNIRLNKARQLVLSKPCDGCQQLIKHFRVGYLIYSTHQGFLRL